MLRHSDALGMVPKAVDLDPMKRKRNPKPFTDVKLPFGLRQGEYVHISQAVSGLPCNCRCPGCGAELVAKKGEGTAHHFAHRSRSDCAYGPESALHDYSKRLVARQTAFRTPDLRVFEREDEYGFRAEETVRGKLYAVESSALERPHGDVVPDIQLLTDSGLVFVEIAVTHFVDRDKRSKLARIGIPTVEIDLSSIAADSPLEAVERAVLEDMSRRKWAYHPDEPGLQASLTEKLRERLSEHEASRGFSWDPEDEDDGRIEDDDGEGWTLMRNATDQFGGEMINEWLQSIPATGRAERYKSLSHLEKLTYHCFLLERGPETLPPFFNRSDGGAPPFRCPSIVWKTGAFFRFAVWNREEFVPGDVVRWCLDRYDTSGSGFGFPEEPEQPGETIHDKVSGFLLELEREGYLESDGFIAARRTYVPTGEPLPTWKRLRNWN